LPVLATVEAEIEAEVEAEEECIPPLSEGRW
jgi:hypothetical protein